MAAPQNPTLMLCEVCQKRFERNAAFTIEFFKDRKFLKKTTEPDYYETFYGAEHHHKIARAALLYFMVGLALKQHLILASQDEDLLGGSFERLAQDYNGRFLEENDYQFWAAYQPEYVATLSAPQRVRIKNLNAIESCIFGYRFFLITDQRSLPPDSLIRKLAQNVDLVIMQVESSKDLFKDFEAFMEERG
ncbi:hypothetical protein [Bdellovibrio svalbardensis]|uniref:DUF4435 domain-containing protein n=1 Tax=Bdellovibrio svalbardensis TaxID=2972972 RepID=A0ABT6DKY4_9BACT|nr:hypothetical protein [Bdellovibrio svalbardensis]MDG0816496.1 hypothetical protein [Bdellovibrio svalbardensis]